MILYPAIDINDGQCVRLLRGEKSSAITYSVDPAVQAKHFQNAGCKWIHVVDLEGAFAGKVVNVTAVRSILSTVDIPLQFGGGIRNRTHIHDWINAGISRVILGTVALFNPNLVAAVCRDYPGMISVSIDVRNGKPAVEGWTKTSTITARDLALKFEDVGVASIIFTDIDRDGAMQGPNLEETRILAQALSIPVIASGGVSSIDDLLQLTKLNNDGVEGVIVGRAIYDGRINMNHALRVLGGDNT
ncbi:phosphoribosylformimino-5-aminoimidazole carboxamide ribotide isomerase [Candidatus Endolissoclinum faulkneri L2]|uniref:1-(5-phosphoribosyl)-5-[(5-phosphoribosylamino)methylideneamino] imidazole-4-carboxamide isomerase n=1 Tax=Candidatus Endolissoclinum faulkneri L2 TaxID=1193729 RepID=K7ZC92_9PROT|nr:1-(5-phosphoribosyl)-5-[(5-phosphoribosylamino)methylideneamino]imidazole-4-carboxamide isomerase [Candidatus Endolissoclinum faulkneri]AFX98391.1 phosphoribosylformimino-5-aminoimidazole carboxamide ribotide isomerase [Candidatus Endolissoclinum faulkneri L2]